MGSRALTVDVHGHVVPETVLRLIEREGERFGGIMLDRSGGRDIITMPGGDLLRPLPAGMRGGAARHEWMRDQGVEDQLVGPWMDIQGNGLPPEHGIPWASALNDAMADGLPSLGAPACLLATVYPRDPRAAIGEMARSQKELDAVGVMMATHFPGGSAADERMDPFWEASADLRMPVVLHPPIVGPASAIPGDKDFRSLYGRPFETSIVATRLIVGGVLERYPALRIVVVHGGGFLPYQAGRLDQQVAAGNIKARLPEGRRPSDYIRDLYFDTAMMDPSAVAFLSEYAPGRVLIGTDHPFTSRTADVPGQLRALPEPARHAVAGVVARQIFRIPSREAAADAR